MRPDLCSPTRHFLLPNSSGQEGHTGRRHEDLSSPSTALQPPNSHFLRKLSLNQPGSSRFSTSHSPQACRPCPAPAAVPHSQLPPQGIYLDETFCPGVCQGKPHNPPLAPEAHPTPSEAPAAPSSEPGPPWAAVKALPPLQSHPRAGRARARRATEGLGSTGTCVSNSAALLKASTHIPKSWRRSTTHSPRGHAASHPTASLQLLPLHQQGLFSFPLVAHTWGQYPVLHYALNKPLHFYRRQSPEKDYSLKTGSPCKTVAKPVPQRDLSLFF